MICDRQSTFSSSPSHTIGVPMSRFNKSSIWHGNVRLSRAFPCQFWVFNGLREFDCAISAARSAAEMAQNGAPRDARGTVLRVRRTHVNGLMACGMMALW
jgi:hypothetical protein